MNAKNWGGARPGSGPIVRHIHLDMATARMLRTLTRERRAISPDITEHQIVTELIAAAAADRDTEYQRNTQKET
jgi:hypothetical protein